MKANDRKKLITSIEQYIQLKELAAAQQTQMDSLKDIITGIAEAYPNEFEGGELLIDGVGLLKYMNNPPKLVFKSSQKSLTEIETIGLIRDLGEKFSKQTINMSRLKIAVEQQDRDVMGTLLNFGIELVLKQRLDIKSL